MSRICDGRAAPLSDLCRLVKVQNSSCSHASKSSRWGESCHREPTGVIPAARPAYPHFDLFRSAARVAELWTDIEFLTMSYDTAGAFTPPTSGNYHELDIVVIDPGPTGRPSHSCIWLGMECKNTGYTKELLKSILGIRREMSLLRSSSRTHFSKWRRQMVPADRGVLHRCCSSELRPTRASLWYRFCLRTYLAPIVLQAAALSAVVMGRRA
jgi:hypothetical protein